MIKNHRSLEIGDRVCSSKGGGRTSDVRFGTYLGALSDGLRYVRWDDCNSQPTHADVGSWNRMLTLLPRWFYVGALVSFRVNERDMFGLGVVEELDGPLFVSIRHVSSGASMRVEAPMNHDGSLGWGRKVTAESPTMVPGMAGELRFDSGETLAGTLAGHKLGDDGVTRLVFRAKDSTVVENPVSMAGMWRTMWPQVGYLVSGLRVLSDYPGTAVAKKMVKVLEKAPESPSVDAKPSNPKDALGVAKVPFSTIPAPVLALLGLAMAEGSLKYGRYNYRVIGVRAGVYYDACLRHLTAWWEGEDIDPDSGLPHPVKAATCLLVLMDASMRGMLEDDRPPRTPAGWQASMNEAMAALLQKYPDPKPAYTERNKDQR